jgi:hypothetical protein
MSIFRNPKEVSKNTLFSEACDENAAETQKSSIFYVTINFLYFWEINFVVT